MYNWTFTTLEDYSTNFFHKFANEDDNTEWLEQEEDYLDENDEEKEEIFLDDSQNDSFNISDADF